MHRRRNMLLVIVLFGIVSLALLFLGPNRNGEVGRSDRTLKVTVSILPQQHFVERVGGEHVDVNVMVLPGESPATYEPRPDQLCALNDSSAYFRIGVPFEDAWMERIVSVNREMVVVNTTQGIERMPMEENDRIFDPHIWLSPSLVKIQAQTICDALVRLDPSHAGDYRANLAVFRSDIDALDAYIRSTLENLQTRTFVIFHPAWGYFAREYDLEMIPIEIHGREPSASELTQVISFARQQGIRIVFVQPESDINAAEIIAGEIGGHVVLIDPLNPDWLNNLRNVANTFAEMMGQDVR